MQGLLSAHAIISPVLTQGKELPQVLAQLPLHINNSTNGGDRDQAQGNIAGAMRHGRT